MNISCADDANIEVHEVVANYVASEINWWLMPTNASVVYFNYS